MVFFASHTYSLPIRLYRSQIENFSYKKATHRPRTISIKFLFIYCWGMKPNFLTIAIQRNISSIEKHWHNISIQLLWRYEHGPPNVSLWTASYRKRKASTIFVFVYYADSNIRCHIVILWKKYHINSEAFT